MGAEEKRDVERLVALAAQGDAPAWHELWAEIHPLLLRLLRQPAFLGRIADREDDQQNIAVAVMARLKEDDFQRLNAYLAARSQNPGVPFQAWLRVVTKRVGIDYVRAHPDYIDERRSPTAAAKGRWIDPQTLPEPSELPGDRARMTDNGTAHELLRYAAHKLPDAHRRALELWIDNESFEDIASRLELADAATASRLVRSAVERLRRQFRDEPP